MRNLHHHPIQRRTLVAAAALGAVVPAWARAESFTRTGFVHDAEGAPIAGARVTDGLTVSTADTDGAFSITTSATRLHISATGYRSMEASAMTKSTALDFTLERRDIRALYLDPKITNTPEQIASLLDLLDTTNANAMVIDVKEEWVWYDTQVPFFVEAGSVKPAYHLGDLLRQFRERDIYTIARLVVFKDPLVAEAYPALAIQDVSSGAVWRDATGTAWVNPLQFELWEANAALALECAEAGFDEIQYDYVRFPTDGDLAAMDFGIPLDARVRQGAIEGFLDHSRAVLLPTFVAQAADIFAWAMVQDDDIGIGQNFRSIANHVDYLCPMIYPSHYSDNQFGLPGDPNDYPYDIVQISLEGGIERIDGNALQIRPWLQDFDLAGKRPYGPDDVRAEISACSEAGTSGWMLFDWANRYNPGNLDPEPATPEAG